MSRLETLNTAVYTTHWNYPAHSSNLLITGASGFLGSQILMQCRAQRLGVHGISRSGSFQSQVARSFTADLVDGELPAEAFVGCDQVLHVAGLAHQFGSKGDDEARFTAVNVHATRRIAQAAAEAGIAHLILVSSVAVYGDGSVVRGEAAPCDPKTPYANSKLEGEQVATEICQRHSIDLTILRMATLYGEGDRGNTQRLIRGIDRHTLPFLGEGQNRKSLVHVQDAANACLAVATQWRDRGQSARPPGLRGRPVIYNVCGDHVQMTEIYRSIRTALGKRPQFVKVPISFIEVPVQLVSQIPVIGGFAQRVKSSLHKWTRDDAYDGSKFASDYDFRFEVDLHNGLARQTDFYRRHERGSGFYGGCKRIFDVVGAAFALVAFALPMVVVATLVALTSKGPILYFSDRVGKDNRIFSMPKFRTMRTGTPQKATHLLEDAKQWLTPLGSFLRKSSLDELPQLFSILCGHMSFVGPRPALFNQADLIALRIEAGVSRLRPGVTGWAQINGRDELAIAEKVSFDQEYVLKRGLLFDGYVLFATILKVFRREGVRSADEGSEIAGWLIHTKPAQTQQLFLSLPSYAFAVACAVRSIDPSQESMMTVSVRCTDRIASFIDQQSSTTKTWIVGPSNCEESARLVQAVALAAKNRSRIQQIATPPVSETGHEMDSRLACQVIRRAINQSV